MLKLAIDWFYRSLNGLLVFCMVVMFVLVLANVIMRFGFNSGIDISEEVPRFMFVWMTFFGAIVAMRERTHIGVNIVLSVMPSMGRKLCFGLCQILIFICSIYMLYSTYLQHEIIYYNLSPVLQWSMLLVYGVSYIAAPAIGLNAIANFIRLVSGQVSDSELRMEHADSELETALASAAPSDGGRP